MQLMPIQPQTLNASSGPEAAESRPIRVAMMVYAGLVREGIKHQLEGEDGLLLVGEIGAGEHLYRLLADTKPDVLFFDAHVPQTERRPLLPMRIVPALEKMGRENPQVAVIVLAHHYFPLVNETLGRVRGYILHGDASTLELATAVRTVHNGDTFYSETARREIFHPIERGQVYKLTEAEIAVLVLIAKAPHVEKRKHARALGMSEATYQRHLQRVLRAFRVTGRMGAVLRALQLGILRVEDLG